MDDGIEDCFDNNGPFLGRRRGNHFFDRNDECKDRKLRWE